MKQQDVFAGTTLAATVRMLFALAIDRKREQYTAFTADVETASCNADMKEGDVVWEPPAAASEPRRNVGGSHWAQFRGKP